jgi:DeoR/GlpR family transcriptional regulator of sugar metabolism
MFRDQRRERILEILQENGTCMVNDLSKLFSVSEPTIRMDLKWLEQKGKLNRQHGGAYATTLTKAQPNSLPELAPRGHEEQKKHIGEKASEFVMNNDSLILDSGSTVTELAKAIRNKKNLNIITNAINIALLLGTEPTNSILLIGGELKLPTLSLTGNKGLGLLEGLHADKLFLATGGISLNEGLTYPGFSDLDIKRAMIQKANTVYVLADSSKIGNVKFSSLGKDIRIDYLITDNGITEGQKEAFTAAGIKVIVAE